MFKKILFCTALIAAIAMTSACSSVRLGNDLNDVKLTTEANYETMGHINVDIWGIYVFNFPIFSGSSRIEGECRMFEDTVTPGNACIFSTVPFLSTENRHFHNLTLFWNCP